MKILFTGGGTGGHFYPIMAVAEEVRAIVDEEKLLGAELYYMSTDPYDKEELYRQGIIYTHASAGKVRKYFSILNFLDLFKTAAGLIKAVLAMYSIFPDVVFSKGGYASFPAVFAARLLRIPVIIHESDSVPGKANLWAAPFATKIALSYPDAARFFPEDKVALTGNPIRKDILIPQKAGAKEFLQLEDNLPTILILGGSQGSRKINDTLLDSLPLLVEKCQIIHQTGDVNFEEVSNTAKVVLRDNPYKERYHPFAHINPLGMKMSAGASDIVISRAGSTIFEIAVWGLPSIIIPIPEEISHDQRSNAYTYAQSGACLVLEEGNLSANLFISEIMRLIEAPEERKKMSEAAKRFGTPDAAHKIARAIVDIALEHEK